MARPLPSARRGRWVPAAIFLATLLFGLSASPFATPPRLHKRSCSAVRAGTAEAVTARERFLSVLEANDGDWRGGEVAKELELLQAANPTKDPALSGTYLDADWLQVSRADYVVGDGSGNYTLGQLSFNMYKPTDMQFRVDKTTQVAMHFEDGDSDARRWDISMDLTCVDERYLPFQAKMTTYGQIVPGKISNRLEVSFSGGDLRPAPGTDQGTLKAWLKAFSEAQEKKTWSLRGALVGWVMRLTMGLSLPDGVDKDGTISFQMKKPPRGHTDILYLDDKLRVTRGNRGSVVVVTRGD